MHFMTAALKSFAGTSTTWYILVSCQLIFSHLSYFPVLCMMCIFFIVPGHLLGFMLGDSGSYSNFHFLSRLSPCSGLASRFWCSAVGCGSSFTSDPLSTILFQSPGALTGPLADAWTAEGNSLAGPPGAPDGRRASQVYGGQECLFAGGAACCV